MLKIGVDLGEHLGPLVFELCSRGPTPGCNKGAAGTLAEVKQPGLWTPHALKN